MGRIGNNLRHLGMIATSPSWRKWWVQIMIGQRNKLPSEAESGLIAPDKASTLDLSGDPPRPQQSRILDGSSR